MSESSAQPVVPDAPPALSVIIPMFREAKRIGPTLEDALPILAQRDSTCEVVLVDDGSDDETVAIVEPFLRERGHGSVTSVRLERHEHNQGKGAAVRTGLGAARGRWRLIMDADNAATVREVDRLLPSIGPGVGLVAGSRTARGAEVEAIAMRKASGTAFKVALGAMGMGMLKDTQCGFKLYRGDVADRVARVGRVDGYAFDLEHLLIVRASGLQAVEVGIAWEHKDGGQVNVVRDGVKMLGQAWALRRERKRLSAELDPLPREVGAGAIPEIVTRPVTPAQAPVSQS